VPFANGGVAVAPHVIERVRSAGGKLLYKARNPGLGRVIDDRHAAMMNQMMQETLTTGTARKAELGAFPAAGKTGTSQDFRDAWFVGYTGHLIAGVWLGNDDNSPTKKLTGGGMPVDIWSRFMKAAHQGLPMADLPGMTGRTIDPAPPSVPAPVPQSAAPLTSMLAPAAPLARDDAMRPVAPLMPLRPPALATAPVPQPQPRAAAPAPRPPQAMAARVTPAPQPARTVQLPPQPRPQVAAAPRPQYAPSQPPPPLQLSNAPRPPGAVGAQQEQRQRTAAANDNAVGNFFSNLFGQR